MSRLYSVQIGDLVCLASLNNDEVGLVINVNSFHTMISKQYHSTVSNDPIVGVLFKGEITSFFNIN